MKSKGQVGLETMFVVGFLVLFFTITVFMHIQRTSDTDFASRYLDAQRACDTVKEAINYANVAGFGARINFTMPPSLGGLAYNATVNSFDQSVIVSWGGGSASCPITTRNVTNSTSPVGNFFALNITNSTAYIARNEDGIVVLNRTG